MSLRMPAPENPSGNKELSASGLRVSLADRAPGRYCWPMEIATWNVNSLRVRLPQLLEWLGANHPDIVALQET